MSNASYIANFSIFAGSRVQFTFGANFNDLLISVAITQNKGIFPQSNIEIIGTPSPLDLRRGFSGNLEPFWQFYQFELNSNSFYNLTVSNFTQSTK